MFQQFLLASSRFRGGVVFAFSPDRGPRRSIVSLPNPMGYFTYRIFQNIDRDRLAEKVSDNLGLYEPDTLGRQLQVTLWGGDNCAGMVLDGVRQDDLRLIQIGYQFGGIWMDVQWEDGDSWDLTIYREAEHQVSHSVNPWLHDEDPDLSRTNYRINRVCELWPKHAARIDKYLLLWQELSMVGGEPKWSPRTGKAYPTDKFEYGDADQIHDFVGAFGIGDRASAIIVKARK